jgi:hypothetical protein
VEQEERHEHVHNQRLRHDLPVEVEALETFARNLFESINALAACTENLVSA